MWQTVAFYDDPELGDIIARPSTPLSGGRYRTPRSSKYRRSPAAARKYLTEYSVKQGEKVHARWRRLGEQLLVKYIDGNVRDEAGNIVLGAKGKLKGKPQPDASLRDTENVPLSEDVETYFKREVLPHAPDAWIDHEKTKIGYEIPFNRHFYVFKPPRALSEIDAELKVVTDRILEMIGGLSS